MLLALIKVANKITMNLYQNLLFSKQALIKVANKKTMNLDQYLLLPNYALIKVANKKIAKLDLQELFKAQLCKGCAARFLHEPFAYQTVPGLKSSMPSSWDEKLKTFKFMRNLKLWARKAKQNHRYIFYSVVI